MRSTRFTTRRETSTDYLYGTGGHLDPEVRTGLVGRPAAAVVDRAVAEAHGDLVDEVVDDLDLLGVVTIGGGTVCDVSGLAALLINRSVDLVLVPTTVVGQVDAAVGGKNGINTDRRKNLVGHFHHPEAVIGDQRFLPTLPRRQKIGRAHV